MSTVEGVLGPVADSRVLVVDDNPANTALVRRILERGGLQVVTEVNDPTEVVEVLVALDPDIVLLDLRMPVLDGYEVLGQVQRHAAATFLPVIVVTADDSHESVQRALAMGAHDFLTKPFDAMELTLRVRNLLQTRAAHLELRRSRSLLRERLDVFEPEMAGIQARPDEVRNEIRAAIDDDAIRIALQPIIDVRDARLVGAEALSRFPASSLGSPAAWFVAAHRVGSSVELERAVVRRALRLLPTRPAGTFLAVNASPALLLGVEPKEWGDEVPWERVVVELTEHVPVEDYTALNRALEPFRTLGARLAVDDTGAGFSSLRHILELRPDVIKLDTGIIRGIDRDPRRAAVAEMMLHFAVRVGADIVAEGVETERERDTLAVLGATWCQGYLFGRPEVAG